MDARQSKSRMPPRCTYILTFALTMVLGSAALAKDNVDDVYNATSILQEAIHAAQTIADYRSKIRVYIEIGRARARAGDQSAAFQKAVEIIWDHKNLTLTTAEKVLEPIGFLIAVATAQQEVGEREARIKTMERAAELAKGLSNDNVFDEHISESFAAIAAANIGFGEVDRAREAIKLGYAAADKAKSDRLIPDGLKISIATKVADAFARVGDRKAAVAFLRQADEALEHMSRQYAGMALPDPTFIQDYQYALLYIGLAQARFGDVNAVKKTFATLSNHINRERGIKQIDFLISSALRFSQTLFDIGNRAEATDFFDKAKELANKLDSAREKDLALSSIASTEAEFGNLKEARTTASQIADEDSRDSTLKAIAALQLQNGDIRGANKTVEAVSGGLGPFFLSKLALAQAKEGKVAIALKSANAIEVDNDIIYGDLRAPIVRAIATARVKAGETKQAYNWAKNLGSPIEKTYALLGIAEGLLQAKQTGTPPPTKPQ